MKLIFHFWGYSDEKNEVLCKCNVNFMLSVLQCNTWLSHWELTMRCWCLVFSLCIGLMGCSTTPILVENDPYTVLHDNLFPHYSAFPVESEDAIFALNEDVKHFVDEASQGATLQEKSVKGLVSAIFDHSELGLLYRSNANSGANTTFYNRSANCLSLSIMTYAMAKHAGFDATFYEVDIPEYWTRRSGFSVLNGHINLQITHNDNSVSTSTVAQGANVDFDPQMIRSHFPRTAVSKRMVMSMFYNNKGADALIANSYTRAYSYFRAAAVLSPELQQTWVNLGILYRKADAFNEAEQSYQYALALNDDNLTAWENLSVLYNYKGEEEKAEDIIAMVASRRKSNPFYHFILGEQALEEGHLDDALTYYRRALRLDSTRHEVLYGMAKLYYQQGDISNAQLYLKRAVKFAPNTEEQNLYSSKLATIASIH